MADSAVILQNGLRIDGILNPFLFGQQAVTAPAAASPAVDPLETRAIVSVKNGDAGAYSYLVEKYMRRVLSVAWGIVRNPADAEDLTQEALVRAFEKIGTFRTGQSFGPWVFRIVTNLSLDLMKHRRKFPSEPIEARVDSGVAPADMASSEKARRIDEAIESLPQMQRVVARLYLVEEFSHSEIASMTNLSEGTVRSHLSIARKKLQQMLSDYREVS
ncbi:MAG TPA: sigma-70 family RNA polymerase sigma factor [Thermoanaerobaculia bacterium]|nr:sigma-70 family RNA polymerase sigma factor [Thermoanaerobaculia bacterium]